MNNTIAPFSFPEDEFNAYDIIRKNKKNRELEIQLSRKGINGGQMTPYTITL